MTSLRTSSEVFILFNKKSSSSQILSLCCMFNGTCFNWLKRSYLFWKTSDFSSSWTYLPAIFAKGKAKDFDFKTILGSSSSRSSSSSSFISLSSTSSVFCSLANSSVSCIVLFIYFISPSKTRFITTFLLSYRIASIEFTGFSDDVSSKMISSFFERISWH